VRAALPHTKRFAARGDDFVVRADDFGAEIVAVAAHMGDLRRFPLWMRTSGAECPRSDGGMKIALRITKGGTSLYVGTCDVVDAEIFGQSRADAWSKLTQQVGAWCFLYHAAW